MKGDEAEEERGQVGEAAEGEHEGCASALAPGFAERGDPRSQSCGHALGARPRLVDEHRAAARRAKGAAAPKTEAAPKKRLVRSKKAQAKASA